MTEPANWRKSSHSANFTNCVELANTLTQLRDSKNTTGPTLHANISALIHTIKANQLDR